MTCYALAATFSQPGLARQPEDEQQREAKKDECWHGLPQGKNLTAQ